MGTARPLSPADDDHSIFMAHALLDEAGLISRFLALSTTVESAAATWFCSPG